MSEITLHPKLDQFLTENNCKDQWINNTINERNNEECAIIAINQINEFIEKGQLSIAFISGFNFKNSPEGIDYWFEIKNKLS
jgi:hypothetical protein